MRRRRSAALRTGGLALLGAVLWWSGRDLPTPGPTPAALRGWAATVDPVVAAFGVVRALAMVLLAWIVFTVVTAAALRRARLVAAAATLEQLTLPVARRLAQALGGVALAAATVAPVSARAAPAAPLAAVVLHLPAADDVLVIRPLDPAPASSGPAVPTPAPTAPPGDPVVTAPVTETWQIAPGDHLWHVAEATLTRRLDRPPTEAETAAYLDELVTANAGRLVVPGEPDLVLPGQVFVLPGG